MKHGCGSGISPVGSGPCCCATANNIITTKSLISHVFAENIINITAFPKFHPYLNSRRKLLVPTIKPKLTDDNAWYRNFLVAYRNFSIPVLLCFSTFINSTIFYAILHLATTVLYSKRLNFGNEEHLFICKIITASSTVGLNTSLKYTKRFRPFHLVLIRESKIIAS